MRRPASVRVGSKKLSVCICRRSDEALMASSVHGVAGARAQVCLRWRKWRTVHYFRIVER